MDPSSLPRLRAGTDSSSAVHAVLRDLVKARGNLTLGMRDFLRVVSSETDMTDGAVLAVSHELEDQGLLERDPCTGGVVMVCVALEVLHILRRSERTGGPGFSWDEACACCSAHDISDGELWASVGRLMVTGHLHAGPDFAYLKLCPALDGDGSRELRQALSVDHPGDRPAVCAWAPARGYSAWALKLMEKNAGKEERVEVRIKCAFGDLGRNVWQNVFFARHYDASESAGEAVEPEVASLPGAVVPAGCVRIDSALGEVPPAIFGEPVQLEFVAPFRREGSNDR